MSAAFIDAHRKRRHFTTDELLELRERGLTRKQAAERLGVTSAAVYARCRAEGIDWPVRVGLARYDDETFKRLWSCLTIGTDEIAASAGVTRAAVCYRARMLGLPSRKKNRRRKAEPKLLEEMWLAGVRCADIARHFKMSHGACVSTAARKLGLPPRNRGSAGFRNGGWAKNITIEEFMQLKLAERMKADIARRKA